jgi:hypothetical protein
MMFMKEQGFGQGGYGDQMARFGAVEVSPMNIFEVGLLGLLGRRVQLKPHCRVGWVALQKRIIFVVSCILLQLYCNVFHLLLQLFKRNETVLLFPGGAREALHGKGEEYKLFWPEKVDFVRMAGIFDAIIVPFAAVGVADSVDIVLDRK